MASIGIDGWLSHASRNGPKLTSMVLVVLISAELLRMATTLAGSQANSPLPPAVRRANARPARVDVAAIVSAHLFGTAELQSSQEPADAPQSAANLALTATFATRNPQKGMAIIGDQGQFKVYTAGDHVGEASLHSVYVDHVVLNRNGAWESLALPLPRLARDASIRAAPRSVAQTASVTAGSDSTEPEPPTAVIDHLAHSHVEEDVEGNMVGIRVVPGADRAAFIRSGLIGGDVIVAVNGTKLDPDHSQDIWKQVSSGTTVSVLRRGKVQDVTLNF